MACVIITVSERGVTEVRIPVTKSLSQTQKSRKLLERLTTSIQLLGEIARNEQAPA